MKNMLFKEFTLAMHPTSIIFLSLSALMLIPNYPYYVTFFYTSLAVFFICLSGRENHDIFYTMTLPIRKRDIVKSRFLHVVILQLAQVLTAIPFAIIRSFYSLPGNLIGVDANLTFFGLSFLMLGLFNLVFFTTYYKDPDKVGTAFLLGSTAMVIYIIVAEAAILVVPFMGNTLDGVDPAFLGYRAVVLVGGILAYIALTLTAYRQSARSFVALDL